MQNQTLSFNIINLINMVVGIFGSWDVSIFAKPEETFQLKLEKNAVYPFDEIDEDRYEVAFRSPWLGISAGILTGLTLSMVIFYASTKPDQYISFFFIAIAVMLYTAYMYKDMRRLTLDIANSRYEFRIKDRLIYRGHVHNIYIRLVGQNSGAGDVYYKVVLNGYHSEELPLTSSTVRKEKLEKLGKKLAARLNLNYFDWLDRSTKHVIRHRCPYESPTSPIQCSGYELN
ncbi:transmembrane protein 249-like [Anneissia japonica]|uniref:transmembrane protein 249-like n=1 Tax=Anneissia japonica TaxID=1529436 RepID=UPI0014258C76|nr:transmembrane protein 249-like [Anneissia japonica]